MNNLFSPLPTNLPEELTEVLAESNSICIERIVSHSHTSPEGFWCDQDENEWVVVLKGRAKPLLEGDDKPLEMGPGDPADRRLLVFTEFKDTLDYLVENLESWGFRVGVIHGGMKPGKRDEPGTHIQSSAASRSRSFKATALATVRPSPKRAWLNDDRVHAKAREILAVGCRDGQLARAVGAEDI